MMAVPSRSKPTRSKPAPPATATSPPEADSPTFRRGYEAGAKWARRMASFTDLEAAAAEAGVSCLTQLDWMRGFASAAADAWADANTATVTSNQ